MKTARSADADMKDLSFNVEYSTDNMIGEDVKPRTARVFPAKRNVHSLGKYIQAHRLTDNIRIRPKELLSLRTDRIRKPNAYKD